MELAVYHDKIISVISRVGSNEKARASDAGADREEIGALLEQTGIHRKALAFVRMLDKQEPEKRDDILRTLHPLLDLMDSHWSGNRTPDMFGDAVEHDAGNEPEPADPADFPDDPHPDDEIAQEAAAFEKHLAEVSEAAE